MMDWDWPLCALAVIGTWLIAEKRIAGFPCWIVANVGFIAFFLPQQRYGMVMMYVVYLGLSCRGWYKWRQTKGA